MRALKWVAVVLGGVAAVLGAAAAAVHLRGTPHYPTRPVALTVQATPEAVARGRKLGTLLCAECHQDPVTGRLSGKDMQIEAQFGLVHSLNITQHPTAGIGQWTDGELAYLLRTGVAKDGRYTPPWMPKLPHLADEDLHAVLAWLRSDDPRLAADDKPNVAARPNFLSKVLMATVFAPYPYPSAPIPLPDGKDPVALGRYLTFNLDCWTCHSLDFTTLDPLEPPRTKGFLGGGNPIPDADGRPVFSTNLTPDDATGLGRWTQAQFVRAMRQGVRPDGTAIRFPMNAYPSLTDDELAALWAYLRTVPALSRKNTPSPTAPPPADATQAQRLYLKYACDACHGTDGKGLCDLSSNRAHYPDDAQLAEFIKSPVSFVPDTRMPAWGGVIPEDELRQVVQHVRTLARPAAP